MIPKALDQIGLLELQQLYADKVREGRDLEYKREFPSGQNRDKVHLLKSVTSMANSGGGDVIYGIDAKDGVPVEICGFSVGDSTDSSQLRLESVIRDCVEPRLQGVEFRWVSVAEGKHALVIRVRGSWNAPHRVIVENHNHFYGRNSVGAYPLDVSELRAAFVLSESVGQRARQFIADRLMQIEAKNTPVPMLDCCKVVAHIIPISAISTGERTRLSASKDLAHQFSMIGPRGQCLQVNLDGAIQFETRSSENYQYIQVFRSGCLETVAALQGYNGHVRISGVWLIPNLVQAISTNLKILEGLGVGGPFVVALSFVNVRGYALETHSYVAPLATDVSRILLPDVLIDEADANIKPLLKQTFDVLWNAFGFEECNV